MLPSRKESKKNREAIQKINIEEDVFNDLQKEQSNTMPDFLESGGFLCGKIDGNHLLIDSYIRYPSLSPSAENYSFDRRALKFQRDLCGNKQIVGMWHTHPNHIPKPSSIDRKTTEDLGIVGCVVSNNFTCFDGRTNIVVQKVKKLPFK